MEYCSKRSLDWYLPTGPYANLMNPQVSLAILDCLLKTINYLHSQDFMHLDLKPGNIFLTEKSLKIGDFGMAQSLKEKCSLEMIGSPFYAAPELKKG